MTTASTSAEIPAVTFWKQASVLLGIMAMLVTAGWAIAGQVFVSKSEYLEAQAKEARSDAKIETSIEQLDKRVSETNGHLSNLNKVLDKITITRR